VACVPKRMCLQSDTSHVSRGINEEQDLEAYDMKVPRVSTVIPWKFMLLALGSVGLGVAACDGTTAPCQLQEADSLPSCAGVVAWVDAVVAPGGNATTIRLNDVHYPRWENVNPHFPDDPVPPDVIVHIEEETEVFLRDFDDCLSCAVGQLPTVGDSVHVWDSGVELRSDPPQYFAIRVEIIQH